MKTDTTNSATHNNTFSVTSVLFFKLICLSFKTGNIFQKFQQANESTNETCTLQKVLINVGTAFLIFNEATCSKTFRRTSTAG